MNPVTGVLVITAAVAVFIALWAWLTIDFRRYHREHPRELEIVEETHSYSVDFAEALRCRGGRMSPQAPLSSTPLLDAYREQR